jgi:DNA invertase Pin-like site-specific DNA recombinase
MKAYWYIRVSGKSQIEGDGPERQREAIKAFCDKYGLEFAGEFFEAGVTGTKEGMDRPKFAELIETHDAHERPVKIIVVERLDRLARDLMISEMILAECRKRKIKIYAVDQGALIDMATDGDDPTRILIRQFMGALAQWEKSMLVKKLAIARARIRKSKGKCEGVASYGELPGEIHTLNVMKNLKHSGLRMDIIATMLNEQHLFNRSGNPWNRKSIFSVLKNNKRKEQLCGALTPNS